MNDLTTSPAIRLKMAIRIRIINRFTGGYSRIIEAEIMVNIITGKAFFVKTPLATLMIIYYNH